MSGFLQSFRRNWDATLAFILVYLVIGIYLGPGYFFLTAFLNGCGVLIHTALKGPWPRA